MLLILDLIFLSKVMVIFKLIRKTRRQYLVCTGKCIMYIYILGVRYRLLFFFIVVHNFLVVCTVQELFNCNYYVSRLWWNHLRRLERVFFVAAAVVKRWKITKKDI